MEFVTCDYCDTPFDVDTRYPVAVEEDDEGVVQLYSFCDATCQRGWESERIAFD